MTPKQSLDTYLAKYDPAIAKSGRAVLRTMRTLLPGVVELVYDNYAALGVGFSPTERPSGIFLSVVLYPRWISLFFFRGTSLQDPGKRLKGSGVRIRHIVLDNGAATLQEPEVRSLIQQAIQLADGPFSGKRKMVIQSIAARQRPRRKL